MGSTADQYQDRSADVLFCFGTPGYAAYFMARNFGHARAVNIQTWENLKQLIWLYKTI